MNNADKPVFPIVENAIGGSSHATAKGLTKREYFAAKAMAAMITGIFSHEVLLNTVGEFIDSKNVNIREFITVKAFEMADAMLEDQS